MALARTSRVFTASVDAVADAIDATNTRDGDPAIRWNSDRTAGREAGSDFTFDIRLIPVDAHHTRVQLSVVSSSFFWRVPVVVLGRPALALTLLGLKNAVDRQLGSDGCGL